MGRNEWKEPEAAAHWCKASIYRLAKLHRALITLQKYHFTFLSFQTLALFTAKVRFTPKDIEKEKKFQIKNSKEKKENKNSQRN